MIKGGDALAIIRKLASVYGITVTTDIDSFHHGAGFCHQLGGVVAANHRPHLPV
ncbi:hypothetical protein [Escherichia coli]|uniref:hypothetical protein n=1 Tax=Escherichia coli TaxID=562 RepID=UPI0039A5F589